MAIYGININRHAIYRVYLISDAISNCYISMMNSGQIALNILQHSRIVTALSVTSLTNQEQIGQRYEGKNTRAKIRKGF